MFKWSLKSYFERRKANKIQAYKDSLAAETGLYFSDVITAQEQGFPWSKYLVNALALFGSAYGSLGCLVSAFHLKIADVILLVACIVFAIVFSFMYIGKRFRVISYLVIWVASVFLVSNFYWIINSGMSAIHNICLNTIDDIFELPQLREYTEYYTDQYVSMTMALCVMALLLTMLLNIFISEYMNPMAVMLITLPAAIFGMYFMFDASAFPMFVLIGSWMLVFSVKSTNSYNGLTRKLQSASSVKKHKHSYGFVTDSKNVSKIALQMLVFILVLTGSLFLVIPQHSFTMDLPTNVVKEKTNQGVKNYLSYGMAAFFSRNSEKTKPGEIDNSGRLIFDGQKEFDVTLIDYGQSRMYLRNFVATKYLPGSYRWVYNMSLSRKAADQTAEDTLEKQNTFSDWNQLYNMSGNTLQNDYQNQQVVAKTQHKLRITVADERAVGDRMLVPYYAVVAQDGVEFVSDGEIRLTENQKEYEVPFYTQDYPLSTKTLPDILQQDDEIKKNQEAYYSQYVCDPVYLHVPTPNQEAVDAFIDKYKLREVPQEEAVSAVVRALTDNFDYTIQPGKVPFGEDFVNYFLSSSHKGYCVHFASAATLIFRRLGIPSRYAEGYVVDMENYDDAIELENENPEDWIGGVDASNAVVEQVPITDANGHAWVEVYKDGFGWVPVEVTQAQSIDSESGLGILGDLLSGNDRVTSATEDIMNQVSQLDVESTKNNVIKFVILLLVILIVCYVSYVARIVIVRHRGFDQNDGAVHVSNRYRQVCAMLELLDTELAYQKQTVYCLSYQKISGILGEVMDYNAMEQQAFCNKLETVIFAGDMVEKEIEKEVLAQLQMMRKQIIKKYTLSQKMKHYFIRVLW